MQANASKFQAMVMKSGPGHVRMNCNVSNEVLTSAGCVKLLGVQLDGKLIFDYHVSALYLRASLKIRALSRIGRFIELRLSNEVLYHQMSYIAALCGILVLKAVQ